MLAEADEHHLVQARFDGPDEASVRFDAAADEDVVGAERMLVEVDGDAMRGGVDDDGFHRRADFGAGEFLGDAVTFDDLALSFGGLWGLMAMAAGFVALLAYEQSSAATYLPPWYPRLRLWLTGAVLLCLLVPIYVLSREG